MKISHLFSGTRGCRLIWKNEAGYSEIIIVAKTLSEQTDRKKRYRTFQNTTKTMSQVLAQVLAPYGHKRCGKRRFLSLKPCLYQDNETDWEFFKTSCQFIRTSTSLTDSKNGCNAHCHRHISPLPEKRLGSESRQKLYFSRI